MQGVQCTACHCLEFRDSHSGGQIYRFNVCGIEHINAGVASKRGREEESNVTSYRLLLWNVVMESIRLYIVKTGFALFLKGKKVCLRVDNKLRRTI